MNRKTDRNSIFELIRIVSMFMIVIYHLLLIFVSPYYPTETFYKGIQIPLHIGVILFVLISGYWGIKCTLKGFLKLITMVAVYFLPIALLTDFVYSGGVNKHFLKDCLFISHTPYWFIRTYLCLYLFSPVLNKYLENITAKNRFILIGVLFFISIYLGTSHGDPSLSDGKNLANFSLLYLLGNTLHAYEERWKGFSNKYLIPLYFSMNFLLVFLYCLFDGSIIAKIIWRISFPYCSPILIINAILLFIIMARYQLHSKWINYIASSMFAVYLIHCQPFIEQHVIGGIMEDILSMTNNSLLLFLYCIFFAVIIMFISIIIDKGLSPVWKSISKLIEFSY